MPLDSLFGIGIVVLAFALPIPLIFILMKLSASSRGAGLGTGGRPQRDGLLTTYHDYEGQPAGGFIEDPHSARYQRRHRASKRSQPRKPWMK